MHQNTENGGKIRRSDELKIKNMEKMQNTKQKSNRFSQALSLPSLCNMKQYEP